MSMFPTNLFDLYMAIYCKIKTTVTTVAALWTLARQSGNRKILFLNRSSRLPLGQATDTSSNDHCARSIARLSCTSVNLT